MGGHAKDEESARQAAAAMGWVDESWVWTPENPAPPDIAELVALNRPKYDRIVLSPSVRKAIDEWVPKKGQTIRFRGLTGDVDVVVGDVQGPDEDGAWTITTDPKDPGARP